MIDSHTSVHTSSAASLPPVSLDDGGTYLPCILLVDDEPDIRRIALSGSTSVVRQLLVADCLVRLCEGLPDVFLVVWAIEVVRITPARFGILTSILMLTAIASYLPAAALARRAEKKPFVVLTYVFFTLFPLAVVASRSFAALAAAFAIGGLREIGEPARKALIVDLADPAARGRTVGTYYTLRGLAVAGAAAAGGALWTMRPWLTFAAAAAMGAAGTAWAAMFLPARPPGLEEGT